MATGYVTPTTVDKFIPEIWAKEIVSALNGKCVMKSIVKNYPHNGKSGDTIHFPMVANLAAEAITPGTDLEGKVNTENSVDVSLNKFYGVPMSIHDIAALQSDVNLMSVYTQKAGEAMAVAIDTSILAEYSGFTYDINATSDITDANLRKAIEYLDIANAPEDDRYLIIYPTQKNALLALDKFTLNANFGSVAPIQRGLFGQIYGLNVVVTTQVPYSSKRKNIVMHRDAIVYCEQQDVKFKISERALGVCTDLVAYSVWGVQNLRADFGVTISTDS